MRWLRRAHVPAQPKQPAAGDPEAARFPPDSPEAVAFELFRIIVDDPANRASVLDAYAECLTAARGERGNGQNATRH
jgi:hypothetical protein